MAEGNKHANVHKDLHKLVLNKKRDFLVGNLTDVRLILDRLERDNAVSNVTARDIGDVLKNRTTSEAIRMLLDDVVSASDRNYRIFLNILDEIKMDETKKELVEMEEIIASETDITEGIKEITISDQPDVTHYDFCILNEDTEIDLAKQIKKFLEAIDDSPNDPVQILLYDDDIVFLYDSPTQKLKKIADISSMQLYIVPEYGDEEAQIKWVRNSLILKSVSDNKSTVRKVVTNKDSPNNKEVVIADIQEIKWYDREKDHFKEKMKRLIDSLKARRKRN